MKHAFCLFLAILMALVAISGCSPAYRNAAGEGLTFPRPDPAVSTTTDVYNPNPFPVWVGLDGYSQDEVPPFSGRALPSKSQKEKTINLSFPRIVGVDEKLQHGSITRVGLYSGPTIVLDKPTLYGRALQAGVVTNYWAIPMQVSDTQGHNYGVLQPGESSSITQLWPGPITFIATSPDWLGYQLRADDYINDVPDDVPWFVNNEPVLLGWQAKIMP